MNIREEVKILLVKNGISMRKLVDRINTKNKTNHVVQNLSNKLINNTIKFKEVDEILDLLGYEFKIVRKTINHSSGTK